MNMLRLILGVGCSDTYKNWCERRDSNSHGLPRWNLNPVRLPIPPLSQLTIQECYIQTTNDNQVYL
jgi:hypothetical protein